MGCSSSKTRNDLDYAEEDTSDQGQSLRLSAWHMGADVPTFVDTTSAVKAAVMVRPMLPSEAGCKNILTVEPGRVKLPPVETESTTAKQGYTFDFDRVFDGSNVDGQHRLFDELIAPAMIKFFNGINTTVLAYGQTNSGKTYTLGTAVTAKEMTSKSAFQVIPRAVAALFEHVQQAQSRYDIRLAVSYMEIYKDDIRDLLVAAPPNGRNGFFVAGAAMPSSNINIRDVNGNIVVEGAVECVVKSIEDVAATLELGNSRRSRGATNMNEFSSRSHAVFTIHFDQHAKAGVAVPEDMQVLKSKLRLVDLAGSERVKDTGATGKQLEEGVNINKGLLSLGNVISALTQGDNRRHIPYRDSKLTRLLQDSLGGGAETIMIACCSPADGSHVQTLNTLRYAARARKICNKLKLNNQSTPQEEIAFLKSALMVRDQKIAMLTYVLEQHGIALPSCEVAG